MNVEYVCGVICIVVCVVEEQWDFYGVDLDFDVVCVVCFFYDVGKCYEYVDFVDDDRFDDFDLEYVSGEILYLFLGYVFVYEVGCLFVVQCVIFYFIGEILIWMFEVEFVKSVNLVFLNVIMQVVMGISLQEWVEEYFQMQQCDSSFYGNCYYSYNFVFCSLC